MFSFVAGGWTTACMVAFTSWVYLAVFKILEKSRKASFFWSDEDVNVMLQLLYVVLRILAHFSTKKEFDIFQPKTRKHRLNPLSPNIHIQILQTDL